VQTLDSAKALLPLDGVGTSLLAQLGSKSVTDSGRTSEQESPRTRYHLADQKSTELETLQQGSPRPLINSGRSTDKVGIEISKICARHNDIEEPCTTPNECSIRFSWLRQLIADSLKLCDWFPESEDMKVAKGDVLGEQLPQLFDALEAAVLDAVLGDTVIALTQMDLTQHLAKEGIRSQAGPAIEYVEDCAWFEEELQNKYHMSLLGK